MAWHVKMDDDPGHKWLREAMLAAAKDRLGAPPGTRNPTSRRLRAPVQASATIVYEALSCLAKRQLIAEIEPAHGVGDEAVERLQNRRQQLDEPPGAFAQANKTHLLRLLQ